MCLLYRSFIVIFMQVLTITCLMRWLRVFEVALLGVALHDCNQQSPLWLKVPLVWYTLSVKGTLPWQALGCGLTLSRNLNCVY